MQTIPDHTLLENLKNGDNASFELLYKFYFPSIAAYINQNCGSTEDAEDIFQEAIIALFQKVQQTDLVLTASLKTYVFAIAKNLWLKKLRDQKRMPAGSPATEDDQSETFSFELHPEPSGEEKITSWLSRITHNCQRILKALFFYREPMASLMQKMGWKNKHTAANQQYKCLQQVRKEKDKEPGA